MNESNAKINKSSKPLGPKEQVPKASNHYSEEVSMTVIVKKDPSKEGSM